MFQRIEAQTAAFAGLVDLAQERLGGQALLASDEFFAGKENLLKPGRGVFIEDKFTDRGKWMDGWESRRKREPGHDWCIIKLGLPGQVMGLDIDTNHFLGNHPPYASVDAYRDESNKSAEELAQAEWMEIMPRSLLRPGSQNLFAVDNNDTWTHIRLNIYPDGGVARFRCYGRVASNITELRADEPDDLAAIENGGVVVACNDMFFGNMTNLIMPGRGVNMGDGWETRRRRGSGHDWSIVKLGVPGHLTKIIVDTAWFKGNYPDRCSLDAVFAPDTHIDILTAESVEWKPLVREMKLNPDAEHLIKSEIENSGPWTHVRLNIFPDGGISRLRVFGTPEFHE